MIGIEQRSRRSIDRSTTPNSLRFSMRSHVLLTAAATEAEAPARARSGASEIWIDAPMAAAAEAMPPPRWRGGNNAANAVSFGFVAIAILVSMFLVVAIVERILRPRRPISSSVPGAAGIVDSHDIDLEFAQMSQRPLQWGTFHKPSRETSSSKGISVLMPGQAVPTFIAHPAPIQAAEPQ